MRIHHIAVYVRDMAVVSEFIEKYFEANRIDLYNNPTTGFSSRFIHFQDGARLELMHRPDAIKCRKSWSMLLCIGQMSRSHMIPCCVDVMAAQQCSHWKTDSKLLM